MRVDLDRGSWIDPDAGSISLTDFATAWLAERPGLRPRTRELYESELRLHILDDWAADRGAPGTGRLMIATTVAEIEWLNRAAREILISEGRLGRESIPVELEPRHSTGPAGTAPAWRRMPTGRRRSRRAGR